MALKQSQDNIALYFLQWPVRLYWVRDAFANRAEPDQAALVRAAWSGSTQFAYENTIRYDPALVDLTCYVFGLCTNVTVYLMDYSKWVELSMNG